MKPRGRPVDNGNMRLCAKTSRNYKITSIEVNTQIPVLGKINRCQESASAHGILLSLSGRRGKAEAGSKSMKMPVRDFLPKRTVRKGKE